VQARITHLHDPADHARACLKLLMSLPWKEAIGRTRQSEMVE
jgi:hypothetical protein